MYREVVSADKTINNSLVLSHQEKKLLEYLKTKENKIATREAKSVLDVAERRARNILKDMVGKGILKSVGRTTNIGHLGISDFKELKEEYLWGAKEK